MVSLAMLAALACLALASGAQGPDLPNASSDHCLLAHRAQLRRAGRLDAWAEDTPEDCFAEGACPPCGQEGTCMLWGDPHVFVFDGRAEMRMLEHGDFWIVRGSCVEIQGRYGTSGTGVPSVITAVAVGGAFLQSHVLTVDSNTGKATWDDREILTDLPSNFSVEGLVRASFGSGGEHIDPGLQLMPLKSLEVELPLGIRLVVNKWPDHLDVLVTMRPLPGGQDGHCGNFNSDSADDTAELIGSRHGGAQVPPEASLLPGTAPPASDVVHAVGRLEDCDAEVRARAEEECRSSAEGGVEPEEEQQLLEACVLDVCFGGPELAREDAAIAHQMQQRALAASLAECRCAVPGTMPGTTTTALAASATTTATPAQTETSTTTAEPTTSVITTTAPTTSETTTTTAMPTTTSTTTTTMPTTTTTTTTAEVISCMLFGDPHVVTFDNSRRLRELGATEHTELWTQVIPTYREWNTFMEAGDFWVVRSAAISIQARYADRGWITGLVIGGSFLQGHRFAVGSSDSSGSGWDGFAMSWDGSGVMESFPSEFGVDDLIRVRYTEDRFYQDSVEEYHQERDNWRSRTQLRLLEISAPGGVRITVALAKNVASWTLRFMDVFITMPFQASGQDGHCGRGVGDFNIDWQGSALAAGESLFSGVAPALLFAKEGLAAAGAECADGEAPEDNRVACEGALAHTEFGMLFVDACVQDVCSGGQGILEHYEAFAARAFHEYAAEAQGKRRCSFPVEPQGVGYYWDPTCATTHAVGCGADGAHHECRLCGGNGTYAFIECPGEQDA